MRSLSFNRNFPATKKSMGSIDGCLYYENECNVNDFEPTVFTTRKFVCQISKGHGD